MLDSRKLEGKARKKKCYDKEKGLCVTLKEKMIFDFYLSREEVTLRCPVQVFFGMRGMFVWWVGGGFWLWQANSWDGRESDPVLII